jgi:FAD/FMN-containing dehydrogenase
VVKDQLNRAALPHGLFLLRSYQLRDRATIGGMISPDASGQGTCIYGKTRDHIREITAIVSDGT